MIETLDTLDKELMLWMNYDGGAFQDAFWYFISGKFTWIPLYLLLLGLLVRRCRVPSFQWKPFVAMLIVTALVVVLSDQIASGLLKNWVARPRPSQPDSGISEMIHIVNGYRGGHFGFVSSHAANTVGIAIWFSLLLRRRWLTYTLALWVALNCYSRIYLGVHYPGDILGGLAVGAAVAIFCYYVIYRASKNKEESLFGTVFESLF